MSALLTLVLLLRFVVLGVQWFFTSLIYDKSNPVNHEYLPTKTSETDGPAAVGDCLATSVSDMEPSLPVSKTPKTGECASTDWQRLYQGFNEKKSTMLGRKRCFVDRINFLEKQNVELESRRHTSALNQRNV